ncbi:hypothetical protein [Nocardia terpenica]|uniref:DUF3168 domain-containing protein n=1 Tax=Nocardia terpenica TaxID=455432 RepID=A0A164LAZ8_9NOCA|nr:hypothetical protein [Nocardia terpenica]KZM72206.1 hypothetical protein AWN90_36630 [Nocardia terpenica]NQE86650.1 hypothetical protein [Nocardia terpenica]
MSEPLDFPDAELVTMALLDDLGWTCTALPDPAEWAKLGTIIAINRVGGGCDDGITDRALMSVVVVDATRPKAWATAAKVRCRILGAARSLAGGFLIDNTREEVGNTQEPDLAGDNRFVESSYWISFRAQ